MKLSHWSEDGNLRMIDVTDKPVTKREAIATGFINIKKETIEKIKNNDLPKGDIFTVAKVNGIMAAKSTSNLIPLCHNLNVTHCEIKFEIKDNGIEVLSIVKTESKTGVEMEALTSVSITLLTIYDMLKPVDKSMVIKEIKLLKKSGGKSGEWSREEGN